MSTKEPTTRDTYVLDRIRLDGFKSIRSLDLKLGRVNVLIGANGAGKSNLISFFEMIRDATAGGLQNFVARSGNANNLLHYGTTYTSQIAADLDIVIPGRDGTTTCNYAFRLEYSAGDTLFYSAESIQDPTSGIPRPVSLGSGHRESRLPDAENAGFISLLLEGFRHYHFHHAALHAAARQTSPDFDIRYLASDGCNIAAILFDMKLRFPDHYRQIRDAVRDVAAPFFRDFALNREPQRSDQIRLKWCEFGEHAEFDAGQLSDGTLRFICLAALLLHPEPPELIIIDEPELGLHPYAIEVLAGMVRIAAAKSQIILATQSVTLLEHFNPEDVIVVERIKDEHGYAKSTFTRLEPAKLQSWLGDYSLGELWEKNVVGGRPHA